MVDLVIENGKVITPQGEVAAAIAIERGKIVGLCCDPHLPRARKRLDAQGHYVLPGLVDPHFHLGAAARFGETCSSETRAAAAGGVTTIGIYLPFVAGQGIVKPFDIFKEGFEQNALVDGFFHTIIGDEASLEDISRAAEVGIKSFKFMFGYKGAQGQRFGLPVMDDGLLFEGLTRISQLPEAWAAVHTENTDIALRRKDILIKEGRKDLAAWNDSRPNFCEAECLARCLFLAGVTSAPLYVVHMTIGEGVEIIRQAKAKGIKVKVETCPQYLTHNSEVPAPILEANPALGNVNPPLRDIKSNQKLWQGIGTGIVDCIGSDQAPRTLEEKGQELWNAPMGLGNSTEMILPVMLSEGVNKGRLSLERVAEVCSANPARIFGLYPEKGAIGPGSDADLVIVDLNKRVTARPTILHSRCDWSIYDGWEFQGWPVATILRGELIAKDGHILAHPGRGRYIPR